MGVLQARRLLVDYDSYVGSNVAVAAGDGINMTELLRVTIPASPGRIRVDFTITVQATTAGQQTSFIAGVYPAGGNVLNLRKGHAALNVGAASGANAEPSGRVISGWFVLPPNVGGDFALGATRTTANAGGMVGASIVPSELLATHLEA